MKKISSLLFDKIHIENLGNVRGCICNPCRGFGQFFVKFVDNLQLFRESEEKSGRAYHLFSTFSAKPRKSFTVIFVPSSRITEPVKRPKTWC